MSARALLACGLIAVVCVVSCEPCPSADYLASWSFEAPCSSSGTTCGFTVERGALSIVSLHHPAEHGLRLAANTTARANVHAATGTMAPLRLQLITRCEPAATLTAQLVVGAMPESDAATERVLPPVEVFQQPGWSSASVVLRERNDGEPVRALVLSTDGRGACDVDDVRIQGPTPDCL